MALWVGRSDLGYSRNAAMVAEENFKVTEW
jgi:hypothetical protein